MKLLTRLRDFWKGNWSFFLDAFIEAIFGKMHLPNNFRYWTVKNDYEQTLPIVSSLSVKKIQSELWANKQS